jgi:BASS family bile acid:Na+ symporter
MDVGVPVVVWLLMLVVGIELTPTDFRRVLTYPKAVLAATAGQLMLLPLLGALLIWALEPAPVIVAGIVLVAASPGGAISNFYTYLARANLALSVTLTAVSTLAAMLTMPILIGAGLALFSDPGLAVEAPVGRMALQLLLMLVLPVIAGMALRGAAPGIIARHGSALRRFGLAALAALVGFILIDQHRLLAETSAQVVGAAVLFSAGALLAGWLVGYLAGLGEGDRFTLMLEFASRNLAIAALVGIALLGRADFVLVATLFFLIQLPLILLAIALRGRG